KGPHMTLERDAEAVAATSIENIIEPQESEADYATTLGGDCDRLQKNRRLLNAWHIQILMLKLLLLTIFRRRYKILKFFDAHKEEENTNIRSVLFYRRNIEDVAGALQWIEEGEDGVKNNMDILTKSA
ncbi:hypothetical protein ACJX0J_031203, partial [Zea mays]